MKKYILMLGVITLLFACSKDKTPVTSANEADPFIRVDNSSSEADHQIYLLYQATGVPVLYTDTLTRTPLKMLNVGYHINSYDSLVTTRYLSDAVDILAGVDFVKNSILPSLGSSLRPYAVLLTDSLYTYAFSYQGKTQVPLNAYLGLQALVLGKVSAIKDMPADTLKAYRKDIFKSILTPQLNQHPELLKDFGVVSAAYYNKYAFGDGSIAGYIPYQPKEAYGLIPDGTEFPNYYPTGDATTDAISYLNVVLVLSKEEFETKYADYPLVLTKYDLIMKVLTNLGFKL